MSFQYLQKNTPRSTTSRGCTGAGFKFNNPNSEVSLRLRLRPKVGAQLRAARHAAGHARDSPSAAHAHWASVSRKRRKSLRCLAEPTMPLLPQPANDQSFPLARPAPPAHSAGVRTEIAASLPFYIARVQAIPPLSREDEYELACRIRDVVGDEDAARKLVEANLRYVVAIALSYRRYGVRLADLISEGNVGLMDRLQEVFRPLAGNARFVTYAAHWIRALCARPRGFAAWSIVGVGAGPLRSKVFFRLRREKAKILASTSDAVEANERLAERFGTTSEKISMMANRLEARDVSLDAKVFDDGAATVLDTVPGNGPSQEEQYLSRERSSSVHACVRDAGRREKLDPRERFIVGSADDVADPPPTSFRSRRSAADSASRANVHANSRLGPSRSSAATSRRTAASSRRRREHAAASYRRPLSYPDRPLKPNARGLLGRRVDVAL